MSNMIIWLEKERERERGREREREREGGREREGEREGERGREGEGERKGERESIFCSINIQCTCIQYYQSPSETPALYNTCMRSFTNGLLGTTMI